MRWKWFWKVLSDIDYQLIVTVQRERRKYYREQLHAGPRHGLRFIVRLLCWPLRHGMWIPKSLYLLWMFLEQPREVKEKLIACLPEAQGCPLRALELYNMERYIAQVAERHSPRLLAVPYRFGFFIAV